VLSGRRRVTLGRLSEASPAFVGYVQYEEGSGDSLQGHIILDRWRLRFESPSVTLAIPLPRLQIEASAKPDDPIAFNDPEQPGWCIQTLETEILEQRFLLQQTHTRAQIQSIRSAGELKRRLWITVAFLLACIVIALVVSSLTGFLVRSLVAKVPLKWERDLGDSLIQEVGKRETFVAPGRFAQRHVQQPSADRKTHRSSRGVVGESAAQIGLRFLYECPRELTSQGPSRKSPFGRAVAPRRSRAPRQYLAQIDY